MEKSFYKAFVAQTPEEVLHLVFKKEEDILIAVSLNNGNYLEGIILDITKDNDHQKSVCMLSLEEQVYFFNMHTISLVTIKQPKKMVVELSMGAISRPILSVNENLTVLQLKRWLNAERIALGEQILDFNIEAISTEELNDRLNIKDVFSALKSVVGTVTKDDLGKEAWSAVNTVVLKQADTLQLNISENTLTISIAIDKALPSKLSEILEEKLLRIL
ncbi:hypothetical protein [Maribacter stanieri]|uniref:Uncharacterized protein n=1 Tax=Maribacter stanieri TaxID=440514 RepID=A0A1I6JXE2_9FLAO|nr:hypothetical protein [Maribacter stanieri]SFR83665.1 hypothetical protein SAMN04488010_3192 [Maribacter stanieri]|tara:strand:- start:129 stop:782 length:654 start_codon:yes stop_codon:yes gene_type:complete